MVWTKVAAGLVLAGAISGAGCVQATPLSPIPRFDGPVASAERVQYYYEDDEYDFVAPPPPPRYRVYRERPAYGYYDSPPRRGYYNPPPRRIYRDYAEDRKEAVKDYRRAQKEVFKERVRTWNRTHGF
jgi:hypothetical protein